MTKKISKFLAGSLMLSCIILIFIFIYQAIHKKSQRVETNFDIAGVRYPIVLESVGGAVYPDVELKPTDQNYKVESLKEFIDLRINTYSGLLISQKRIGELIKWGSELPLKVWKEILINYSNSINLYLGRLIKDDVADRTHLVQLLSLKRILLDNQVRLSQLITQKSLSFEEKQNLDAFTASIFESLFAKVNEYLPPTTTDSVIYPLFPLVSEGRCGTFNLFLIVPENSDIVRFSITTKAGIYPFMLLNSTTGLDQKLIAAYEVKIDCSESFISLEAPSNEKIRGPWIKNDDGKYAKRFNLNNTIREFNINLFSDLTSTVTASLYNKDTLLTKDIIDSQDTRKIVYKKMTFLNEFAGSDFEFVLNFVDPKYLDKLTGTDLEVEPVYTPKLSLVQVTNNNTTNTSKSSKPSFFSDLKSITTGFFILILALIIFNLRSKFIKLRKDITLAVFILILLIIYFDIFIVKARYPTVIYFVSLLWLIIIIRTKMGAVFSYGISLIFLTTTPIFAVINNILTAEKSATWIYVFFFLGMVQSLIESVSQSKEIVGIEKIKEIYGIFVAKSYLILQPVLHFIKKSTNRYLVANTILIFYIVFLSFYKMPKIIIPIIQKKIKNLQTKNQRNSMNPKIVKIGPSLAYHGTYIAIDGSGFSWQGVENVRLMSSLGEIKINKWTNSRIIFQVPLHWKIGNTSVWVERNIKWNGADIIAKSQPFIIEIIPIKEQFTTEDDKYFDQLKKLDSEIQKLNGYKP